MITRLLFLGALGTGSLSAGEIWTPVAPLPRGLAGFAAGTVEARLVVAGGTHWDGDHKLTRADVQIYDPAANRWEKQSAWPRAFTSGPFGIWQGRLLAWGGDDGRGTRADRANHDTPDRKLPQPVGYAGSAILDGKLYVLGGTPDLGVVARATDRFAALDLASGATEELPAYPSGPHIHVALVSAGGRLWAFSGARWDESLRKLRNSAEAWSYDPAGRLWRPLAPLPFAARGVAIVALDERHLLLAGGYRDDAGGARPTTACVIYDTEKNDYRAAPDLPTAVMLAGLVRLGSDLYVLGGEDAPRHRSAQVYRVAIDTLLAPTPR